jgi:cytochrome P450
MVLNPDAQARAQAEIDAQIGPGRLPTLSDRERLPYVEALIKEVLRLSTVLPTAIPHKAHCDDAHDGYFIPKGTIVVPNVWYAHLLHLRFLYSRA